MQRKALSTLTVILMLAILPAAFASTYKPLYPGFPGLRESKAYKTFAVRPLSDLSKILYLIDRFAEADIQILYENQSYTAPFATTVSRWFLARNYRKQTPEVWVKQWCSHSIFSNKLIYIKLNTGEFLLAKDVLLGEIEALEEAIRENQLEQVSEAVPDVSLAKSNGALVQNLPNAPKPKLS